MCKDSEQGKMNGVKVQVRKLVKGDRREAPVPTRSVVVTDCWCLALAPGHVSVTVCEDQGQGERLPARSVGSAAKRPSS